MDIENYKYKIHLNQEDHLARRSNDMSPPRGFSQRSIGGLLVFVKENYEDLKKEVQSGKYPDFEAAIDGELANLRAALEKLHLDEKGDLVERS
jgi:hypothetical protein